MPEFAVFNDIIGVRDTTPHIKLNQAYMTAESAYVHYDTNAVRRSKGRSEALSGTVTPDGNPIIRYHFHRSESGTDYMFAFTAEHAYVWDELNTEWDLMHTCASACTYWSTASFNSQVVATNYVDKVLVWLEATPTTAFAVMGAASGIDVDGANFLTKAKFVTVYENYLHLLYTEEGGVTYPARDRWSSRGDESDFDENGAGDAGARDFTAGLWITGVGKYDSGGNSLLVIGTNKTIETEWLVVEDLVFEWDTYKHDVGIAAPDSMVQDANGNLYFLGTDNAFHRFGDDRILSDDIDATVRNLHPTNKYYTRGYHMQSLDRIVWSVPYGGSATENNTILALNLDILMWDASMPMAVSAFGQYSNTVAYTIDTIPFDTIDTIGWDTIDNTESTVGYISDIVSDYSGLSWYWWSNSTEDAGESYTSELVIGTDLSPELSLNYYKRLDGGFWVWLKKSSETSRDVNIYFHNGESDTWSLEATIDTTVGYGDIVRAYCPSDYRGRNFLIKVQCDGEFAFYGIVFRYTFDGEF